jgi:uncharacterized protein (TIGR02145 family)
LCKFDNFGPGESDILIVNIEMQKKNILIFAITLFMGFQQLNAQPVKDIDGNVYPTISIDKQVWMAENLKTTNLNDGTAIPLVTDDKKWSTLKTPGYCWFNNDITNKDVYGALYNWFSVNTKKICPVGWHVPSITEWSKMISYLGDPGIAGDKLKEAGLEHWKGNFTATNSSDFTALPGGLRLNQGPFPTFGNSYAVWWSATEHDSACAWNRGMINSSSNVYKGFDNKGNGFSVRCLKD